MHLSSLIVDSVPFRITLLHTMPRKKPRYQKTSTDQRNRGETAAKKAVEYGIMSGRNVFCLFQLEDPEQYQVVCSAPTEQFPCFFRDVIIPQCLKFCTVTETRAELDRYIDTVRARADLGVQNYNLVEAGPAVGQGDTQQARENSDTLHSIATMLDAYAETKRPDLRSSTRRLLEEVNEGVTEAAHAFTPPPPVQRIAPAQPKAIKSNRRFYIQCDPTIHEAFWPNAYVKPGDNRDPGAIEPLLYHGFSKSSVGAAPGPAKRTRASTRRTAKRRKTGDETE